MLGNNFVAITEMYEEEAAEMAKVAYSKDGLIDENELRDYLRRNRKDGIVRRDVDTRIHTLLTKFGDGTAMTLDQFRVMQAAIIDDDPEHGSMKGAELRERLQKLEGRLAKQDERLGAVDQKVDARLAVLERKLDALTMAITSGSYRA